MNLETDSSGRKSFTIHLVSDATGTTLQGIARAALAQFEDINPTERFWPMVRSMSQLERVITEIRQSPGPVIFTLVDKDMRRALQRLCDELVVPCMPIMDPVLRSLSAYLGMRTKGIPGLQHALDEAYFQRIDAVDFAMSFDDGQSLEGIEQADVILTGVSRTSKTPTCIFLARRGIRAANVPITPGVPFPENVLKLKTPLFVGLTESPERLVQIRRNRLKANNENDSRYNDNAYLDLEKVEDEVRDARRLFSKHKWPVIDVTRRSVEETAAEIMILLQKHRQKLNQGESDES